MRDIQRTRFSETFPSTNKCISCSHLAIFNRFIFEGSSSHSFWTFLGTSSIESNGTRVPFRVWGVNFHTNFLTNQLFQYLLNVQLCISFIWKELFYFSCNYSANRKCENWRKILPHPCWIMLARPWNWR